MTRSFGTEPRLQIRSARAWAVLALVATLAPAFGRAEEIDEEAPQKEGLAARGEFTLGLQFYASRSCLTLRRAKIPP